MNTFHVFGVCISDLSETEALGQLDQAIAKENRKTKVVFFVNAHTLNLASRDENYRDTLNSADWVFGDGTGVRWAARAQGRRIKANLTGTDLVPEIFDKIVSGNYSYFLLGADEETIERAAGRAIKDFPKWRQAGYHHGYMGRVAVENVICAINDSGADILLVGMGNPLQEQFIARYRDVLKVKLAIGVGGLFDHWGGNLKRAPAWVRSIGFEWFQLMLQQRRRIPRYMIGNPMFLIRVLKEHLYS